MKLNLPSCHRILFPLGWLALILFSGLFVINRFQGEFSIEVKNWKLAAAGMVFGILASSPIIFIIKDYLIKPGTPHKYATSFVLTFLPSVAKYIPGKIWSVAGFLHQAKVIAGISAKDAAFSQVYMQIIGLISSSGLSILGLLYAGFFYGDVPFRKDLVMCTLLLLLVAGVAFVILLKVAVKMGHRINEQNMPKHIWILSFQKLMKGISLFLFVCAYMPVQGHLFEIVFTFIISMQLGLLAFFAPAGIGVVEGAYVYLLSGIVSTAWAFNIAIIARIWQTGIDFILAILAFIVKFFIIGQMKRKFLINLK